MSGSTGKASRTDPMVIAVAEAANRGVLLNGGTKLCDSLNCRQDISLPQLTVIRIDPSEASIQTIIEQLRPGIVIMGAPGSGIDSAILASSLTSSAGVPLAIAEQSVGSPGILLSAGEILSLLHSGATAIFREYDYLAEDAVLRLVLEHGRQSKVKSILIGEPALRAKRLINEVRYDWNDSDIGDVYRPDITFRIACALAQAPELDSSLNTREKIAREGFLRGWLPYNIEDSRKAIGSLTRVWGLHTRTLSMLPQEARRRGFPTPNHADAVFNFIENIDADEAVFNSASGTRFDILRISNL